MNFSVPHLDALLFPSEGKDSNAEGASAAEPLEARPPTEREPSAGSARKNTVKELLSRVSKLVASARAIPSGDEYSIRTSGTTAAASATHRAAEETLEALELISSLSQPGNTFAAACRHNLCIHRALSGESSASCSSSGSETKEKKQLFPLFQDFLDDLFDDVDRALAHHDKNPNTPLPQNPKQRGDDKDKSGKQSSAGLPSLHEKNSPAYLFPPGHVTSLSVFSSSSSSSLSFPPVSKPDDPARYACKKVHEELAFSVRGRPQRAWLHLIDNFSVRFVPRLPSKPHAKEPLHPCLLRAQKSRLRRMRKIRKILEGEEEGNEESETSEEEPDKKTTTPRQSSSSSAESPGSEGGDSKKAASLVSKSEEDPASLARNEAPHGRGRTHVPAGSRQEASSPSSSSPSTARASSLVLSPSLSFHLHGRGVVPSPATSGRLTVGSGFLSPPSSDRGGSSEKCLASSSSYTGFFRSEEDGAPPLPHVYEHELQALRWRGEDGRSSVEGVFSGPHLFTPCKPKQPKALCDTPLVWITTKDGLQDLVDELASGCHPIVAFDLEHHSFSSYRGFTCLIQISTRDKDYLLDPFPIFEHLHLLNEVTANPGILKIFHGAESDIIWLQRDFSVYVVNMFDTCIAARVLALPGGASLANVLRVYCGVEANKRYQLADWRKRPLTADMEQYARSDTHYLPYLFDVMRNQLLFKTDMEGEGAGSCGSASVTTGLEEDLEVTQAGEQALQFVMERSRDVCLRLHVELPFDAPTEAAILLKKNRAGLSPLSYVVFINLLSWRDTTARRLDRSPISIATPAHLLLLAQKRPTSSVDFNAAIRPVPAALRRFMDEIVKLIQKSLMDTEAAERAAFSCSSPRPSPRDLSSLGSSSSPHEGQPSAESREATNPPSRSVGKRKRERHSGHDEDEETSSDSSTSSDDAGEEILPRALVLQQAAAKSRKKALSQPASSSSSLPTTIMKNDRPDGTVEESNSNCKREKEEEQEEEEEVDMLSLEITSNNNNTSTVSSSTSSPSSSVKTEFLKDRTGSERSSAFSPQREDEKENHDLARSEHPDRSVADKRKCQPASSGSRVKKTQKTRGLIVAPLDLQQGADGTASPLLPTEGGVGTARGPGRKRRRTDLPKVVMNVALTEAMIEKASFPDFLKPISSTQFLYVPPSELRGAQGPSSSVPSSSRWVARRVYEELQLLEQLYLLVDHERANDLTECLQFPSLSPSPVTTTSTSLAAPSSSDKSPQAAFLTSEVSTLSDNVATSQSTMLTDLLPSVILPAPPPPAALVAALGGSPSGSEHVGRERSVRTGEEEAQSGVESNPRESCEGQNDFDGGEEEEVEEREGSGDLEDGKGGAGEVFIVAKQKWKRRKRRRGKGGGGKASGEGLGESQNSSFSQQEELGGNDVDGEKMDEGYLAVDIVKKRKPSSFSFPSKGDQVSASPRLENGGGVCTPSAHTGSSSRSSGGALSQVEKSAGTKLPEGHPDKRSVSRTTSSATQVKREPSELRDSARSKTQSSKQQSSDMSWLPAAFVDRKLTAAPLPTFRGKK